MKTPKTLLLLMSIPLLLTSCSISQTSESEPGESMITTSESGNDSSGESTGESGGSESEDLTGSSGSGTTYLDGNRLYIAYGDYVEYVDSTKDPSGLEAEYTNLTSEVKGEANGVLQTNYEVGLSEFFNIENKIEITINISSEELEKLNNDHSTGNRETYRVCDLDITYLGLHFHYEQVGIRQKGNTSRGEVLSGDKINLRHYKLSFEETFDDEFTETPMTWTDSAAYAYREDRKFFGADKIDIRWNRSKDTTYLREYYSYEMYRANGGLAPHSNVCQVIMNHDGIEDNMGVYLAVENVNKGFIKRNIVKASRGGDLYKLTWGSNVGATFNSTDDYLFGVEYQTGSGSSFTNHSYTYDLKTNKDSSDHSTIKSFISDLSEQHGNTAYEFMNERSVYSEFLAFVSCSYLLGDPDDLRGNYNNAYVYFTGDGSQAIFIPTDHDRSFGVEGYGHTSNCNPFEKNTGYAGGNDSNLFNKTLFSTNSTTIRPEYLSKIQEIIDGGWMSIDKYTEYFNIVKNNYSDCLSVGSNINESTISFSLSESSDQYSGNYTVENYMANKVSAYNSYSGS